MRPIIVLAAILVLCATGACAEGGGAAPEGGLAAQLLGGLVPLVLFVLLMWVFLKRAGKGQQSYQQRAAQHMDRIEQKYDRIIQLLEGLLGSPRKPPEPPPLSPGDG